MPPLSAAPCPRRRHLRPEVLAPSGLCCPGHPRLPTSSASQERSAPFPSIRRLWARSLTFIGSSCLPSSPSGLSLLLSPELPPSLRRRTRHVPLSSFRAGTGHRVAVSTLGIAHCPLESAPCGTTFSTLHPFALATALLVARLPG